MAKQDTLRPVDLVVLVALAVEKRLREATFSEIGETLGISSSTAHSAVKRLQTTGLLRPGSHKPNAYEFLSFVEYGAKHAFPAAIGREVRGVPTAHSGPVLSGIVDDAEPVVWPDPEGSVRGIGLAPLYPNAKTLPQRSPDVYAALTLVDAMRVGQARERNAARTALQEAVNAGSAVGS